MMWCWWCAGGDVVLLVVCWRLSWWWLSLLLSSLLYYFLCALRRVNGVLSTEELKDVYQHFMLHHNREVVEMQNERTAHHRGENDHPDPDKNSGELASRLLVLRCAWGGGVRVWMVHGVCVGGGWGVRVWEGGGGGMCVGLEQGVVQYRAMTRAHKPADKVCLRSLFCGALFPGYVPGNGVKFRTLHTIYRSIFKIFQ